MQSLWVFIVVLAVFALLYSLRSRQNVQAAIFFAAEHRNTGESSPEGLAVAAPIQNNNSLLLKEMQRFDQSINLAVQHRTLQYFDVGQNLTPIHRAVGTASGFLRPAAGWCLLFGLMITLFNLQRAVGDLSGAFSDISRVGQPSSASLAEGRVSAKTREQNVTDRMAGMADMASRAFRVSLAFITIALFCGISSTFLEKSGRKSRRS